MFRPVPTYCDGNGNTVQFVKIDNVPGFSHRVIVNKRAVDWLSDHTRPSAEVAEFFAQKHGANSVIKG